MMCMLLAPVIPSLGLSVKFSVVLLIALKVVATASVVLVLYRMVDVLARVMTQRASKTDTRLDDQLVPLIRKTLKTALIVIAVLFILQNLDVDVGSLLAGLGIGGLAFALAAKDTLANFFGSLMIFVDRPFQIGDWVKLNGVEGTVEEVGFRSTRVRTFYQSLVTIPNSSVADSVIDNMGERRYRRFKLTLGLTYGATPEQVQAYVEGLRALLRRNPAIWYEGTQVHFYNYGASSLEILIYSFLDVPDWSEELRQRHNLLLEMYRLADAVGVSFAFPSQSVYLESTPEHPARSQAPSREQLQAVVRGFGPGGDMGRPQGEPISDSFGRGGDVMRGSSDDAGE
jgi:MscS family membrane protein